MSKKLAWSQALVLLGGAVFAWYTTVQNFARFYRFEGTLFKIHNCAIPNPVTEPCFYGAVAFLIAFVWMLQILRAPAAGRQLRYLFWFLAAGVIFAWVNVAREFAAFYTAKGAPVVGCSATLIVNPFTTPCFVGASIFLLSLLLTAVQYSRFSKSHTGLR